MTTHENWKSRKEHIIVVDHFKINVMSSDELR